MTSTPSSSRRLAAILMADVVGFSRLMHEDEAGTLAALKDRRRGVLEPVVKGHGGRIVKVMGDGVLVEFGSAVNAVTAALELQRRMAEANAGVPEGKRIVLRIGINLGDVIGEGSDIYGDGVNIAARLEGLAEPGGICVSAAVYDQVRGKLPFSATDLGEQALENIDRPVKVFRIGLASNPEAGAKNAEVRDRTTIAVLPFTNMSGNAADDTFADNITEDIITELSHYRHLAVLARNTTFVFKGKSVNVSEIGRQLGADLVLEGSIRKSGSRVRVTIQLIDAERGAHSFADQFERTLDDEWGTFDDLVDLVVSRLEFNIYELASEQLRRRGASSTPYALTMRAQHLWQIGEEQQAQDCLEKAIDLESEYAPALALLMYTYAYRYYAAGKVRGEHLKEAAVKLADRALAVEKRDPMVLYNLSRGFSLLADHEKALKYSELALKRHPRSLDIQSSRGYQLVCAGFHEEGRPLQERLLRLGPRLPVDKTTALGDTRYIMGDYEGAYRLYSSTLSDAWWPKLHMALHLAQLGRQTEAMALLGTAPLDSDIIGYARKTVDLYALPEDRQHLREGFRKLGLEI